MRTSGVYLVFGAEGSGKSTLAELLSGETGLPHVSSGRFVRLEEQKATLVGKAFRERTEAYIEDDLISSFILSILEAPEYQNGFIIEGFPRNTFQLNALQEFLTKKNLTLNKAIYVTLPEAVAIERLMKRGRADDTPELIAERLRSFHEKEAALIEAVKKSSPFVEIDNSESVDRVYIHLQELLND